MNIHQRFVCIVDAISEGNRRWRDLFRITGLNAERWRRVYVGIQNITPDLIFAICEHWPQYSLWFLTGRIDVADQQTAPPMRLTANR